MGSYTSVVNDTPDCKLYIRYGANQLGLTIAQLATTLLGFVAAIPTGGASLEIIVAVEVMESALDVTGDILEVTSDAIEAAAQNAGLRGPIAPGGSYKSDELSLSLVHQANVVVERTNSDGTMTIYSGDFTVWSGSTKNSTKTYNLSEHLGDLQQRTVTIVDQKTQAPEDLTAKISTYKTLVQQTRLKV